MINANMRFYDYYTFEDKDEYGDYKLSDKPTGQVRICINTTTTSVQGNINYTDAEYIGLTLDKSINDKCVIQYGDCKLKVLYTNNPGKYSQVFLAKM